MTRVGFVMPVVRLEGDVKSQVTDRSFLGQIGLDADQATVLTLTRMGAEGNEARLLSFEPPGMGGVPFALVGEISCRVDGYASLLLIQTSWNDRGQMLIQRMSTMDAAGPAKRFEGEQAWRPFVVEMPWVETESKSGSVDVVLHWSGTGEVSLRHLRLVRTRAEVLPVAQKEEKAKVFPGEHLAIIDLDENGIHVDGRTVAFVELGEWIRQKRAADSSADFALRLSKKAPYSTIAGVIRVATESGLQGLPVLTEPTASKPPISGLAKGSSRFGWLEGIFVGLLGIAFLAGAWIWRTRRRREGELRRIASLDSVEK